MPYASAGSLFVAVLFISRSPDERDRCSSRLCSLSLKDHGMSSSALSASSA